MQSFGSALALWLRLTSSLLLLTQLGHIHNWSAMITACDGDRNNDDDDDTLYIMPMCVTRNDHFLQVSHETWTLPSKLSAGGVKRDVTKIHKCTHHLHRNKARRSTLGCLWPSVDDDDGDYTLAPPGHIAIAIEVQWLQSTARVRKKTILSS